MNDAIISPTSVWSIRWEKESKEVSFDFSKFKPRLDSPKVHKNAYIDFIERILKDGMSLEELSFYQAAQRLYKYAKEGTYEYLENTNLK